MTKDQAPNETLVFGLWSSVIARSRSIPQNRQRGVPAGRPGDAAAGVRAAAAHIQVADRRAVVRPLRRWPQEEDLLERQFAVKDMAGCDANDVLDIRRRHDMLVQDD